MIKIQFTLKKGACPDFRSDNPLWDYGIKIGREIQHPVLCSSTKNGSEKLFLLGGFPATRYSAISCTRVSLLLMCGLIPVPLGPSFLNSLNAYNSSGYPLEMLPENYNDDRFALQIRCIVI